MVSIRYLDTGLKREERKLRLLSLHGQTKDEQGKEQNSARPPKSRSVHEPREMDFPGRT